MRVGMSDHYDDFTASLPKDSGRQLSWIRTGNYCHTYTSIPFRILFKNQDEYFLSCCLMNGRVFIHMDSSYSTIIIRLSVVYTNPATVIFGFTPYLEPHFYLQVPTGRRLMDFKN